MFVEKYNTKGANVLKSRFRNHARENVRLVCTVLKLVYVQKYEDILIVLRFFSLSKCLVFSV